MDSEQLSLGLGFQVIHAAKLAQQKKDLDEILYAVQSVRNRVYVYALLDTFDYIQRSGRVSWAKARLGSMFNIKPIVELKDRPCTKQGFGPGPM